MLLCVTWVFAVDRAGVAGEGPIMERRGDQELLAGSREDVRGHHQGHDYQSKDEAASLPLPEPEEPAPALVRLGPHFEDSQQVHLLTIHTEHDLVVSLARGVLLAAVMGASSAADPLFVRVVG